MKAARGSLKIYKHSESVTKHDTHCYKRSHSWCKCDFYQTNQLEIKLTNKN